MTSRLSLALVVCTLLLAACSGGGDSPSESRNAQATVSLGEIEESHLLRDDMRILGSVNSMVPLEEDRYLLSDNSPGVALFEEHEMVRSYGAEGEGPCEYTQISAMDVNGDSLFVLNSLQAKIITYRISTGECLGERDHSILASRHQMSREGDFFFMGRISYIGPTPDSTQVFTRLYDSGETEDLPLQLGDLNTVKTVVQARSPSLNYSRQGRQLFAYYPLTEQIYAVDVESGELDSFPIRVNLRREEIEEAGEDIQQILEIIQNQMEWVYPILATERWVATGILSQDGEQNDRHLIRFYSHSGDFMGETELENRPLAVNDGRLVLLRESTDPGSDYTYELVYRNVSVE